jgi:hypothetical protein
MQDTIAVLLLFAVREIPDIVNIFHSKLHCHSKGLVEYLRFRQSRQ